VPTLMIVLFPDSPAPSNNIFGVFGRFLRACSSDIRPVHTQYRVPSCSRIIQYRSIRGEGHPDTMHRLPMYCRFHYHFVIPRWITKS
jgi:hypothetical protein